MIMKTMHASARVQRSMKEVYERVSGGKIPYRNPDGYADPTAYAALSKAQVEQDEADVRCQQLIRALKTMIDLSDYDLLARIELRDRKTGRNYR